MGLVLVSSFDNRGLYCADMGGQGPLRAVGRLVARGVTVRWILGARTGRGQTDYEGYLIIKYIKYPSYQTSPQTAMT